MYKLFIQQCGQRYPSTWQKSNSCLYRKLFTQVRAFKRYIPLIKHGYVRSDLGLTPGLPRSFTSFCSCQLALRHDTGTPKTGILAKGTIHMYLLRLAWARIAQCELLWSLNARRTSCIFWYQHFFSVPLGQSLPNFTGLFPVWLLWKNYLNIHGVFQQRLLFKTNYHQNQNNWRKRSRVDHLKS